MSTLQQSGRDMLADLRARAHYDGHQLAITGLQDDGRPILDVICPGEQFCEAKWFDRDEHGPIDAKFKAEHPCWLRYWIQEDDAWREGIRVNGPGEQHAVRGAGPWPIGWHWSGEWVDIVVEEPLLSIAATLAETHSLSDKPDGSRVGPGPDPLGRALFLEIRRGEQNIASAQVAPTATSVNASPALKAMDAYGVDVWLADGKSSAAHVRKTAYVELRRDE